MTNLTRPGVTYRDLDLPTVSSDDLMHIEMKAKALNIPECLDYLAIPAEILTDAENAYISLAHRRGRASAINIAAEKLFASMSMRNGGATALSYLQQMSGTFSIEATPNNSAKGFSFQVVMPEDET